MAGIAAPQAFALLDAYTAAKFRNQLYVANVVHDGAQVPQATLESLEPGKSVEYKGQFIPASEPPGFEACEPLRHATCQQLLSWTSKLEITRIS